MSDLLANPECWPVQFGELWGMYPRKEGLARSLTWWMDNYSSARPAPWEQIKQGLERWRHSDKWQRDDGQFVPGLLRFLSEQVWMESPRPTDVKNSTRRGNSAFTHREDSPYFAGPKKTGIKPRQTINLTDEDQFKE